VVHHVRGPEQADAVVAAVERVVGQVVGEEEEHERPPRAGREMERAEQVDAGVERGGRELPDARDDQVAGAHRQAGARVVGLVADVPGLVLVLVRRAAEGERLERHREEEEGDCRED
jgi:hypothetical protein